MNPRPGITFLIICLLFTAATQAGDGASSTKDALTPSAKDASPLSPKSSKDIIRLINYIRIGNGLLYFISLIEFSEKSIIR